MGTRLSKPGSDPSHAPEWLLATYFCGSPTLPSPLFIQKGQPILSSVLVIGQHSSYPPSIQHCKVVCRQSGNTPSHGDPLMSAHTPLDPPHKPIVIHQCAGLQLQPLSQYQKKTVPCTSITCARGWWRDRPWAVIFWLRHRHRWYHLMARLQASLWLNQA